MELYFQFRFWVEVIGAGFVLLMFLVYIIATFVESFRK
jgi:hypothetical protein